MKNFIVKPPRLPTLTVDDDGVITTDFAHVLVYGGSALETSEIEVWFYRPEDIEHVDDHLAGWYAGRIYAKKGQPWGLQLRGYEVSGKIMVIKTEDKSYLNSDVEIQGRDFDVLTTHSSGQPATAVETRGHMLRLRAEQPLMDLLKPEE